ncbi:cell division protein FtsL [Pseudotabrizicola sp. L79]|uniref:cell division protein FtsL n=1 Tax=Pseudotabrizicola sp. L79 TaxID=3118402 RepID=UPI002F9234D7
MRPAIYILSFIALLSLGFWAYREHYETRDALRELTGLQSEIADLREALALQRAEWAYLNRPDRLRDLAALNFDRLGLLPLEPGQFGDIATVSYPPIDTYPADLENPVSVSGEQDIESSQP